MLAAANCVLRVESIGEFIHLRVRQSLIAGYYADSVRMFGDVLLEASNEGIFLPPLRGELGRGFRISFVQPLDLLLIAILDVAHFLRRYH